MKNITKSLQNVSNNVQSAIQPGIALDSSLCTDYLVFVYYLYFNSGDVDLSGSGYRSYGHSVRPVCPSQN
ncbi:MAG: hypothetical protein KBT67_06585 [bacterium]|nr:hypothetical protein [Candidatus Limimorpha caballi]